MVSIQLVDPTAELTSEPAERPLVPLSGHKRPTIRQRRPRRGYRWA